MLHGLLSQPVDVCFWGNIVPASLFLLASQARSCGLISQPVDACFWGNIVPASLFLLARQAMCYMVCLTSLLMFVSGAIYLQFMNRTYRVPVVLCVADVVLMDIYAVQHPALDLFCFIEAY